LYIRTYYKAVTKRTSLNLDFELLDEAKEVLETSATTETIHRALSEVVRQARLQRLAKRRFDLSADELAALRTARTADEDAVSLRK
jgi:Arc/MetJ family transcription regulator